MRKIAAMIAGMWIASQAAWATTMTAPQILHPGDEGYPALQERRIQMVSSLAVTPGGRLWVLWYAGPTPREDDNNYIVLATSDDHGATWREVMVVDPDGRGPVRAFDPELWLDPQGRVWMFWAQAVQHGREAQLWTMRTEHPDNADADWSKPFHVAPGVMMCKPTALSDGEWLLPISDWNARMGNKPDGASGGAWISADQGKTFTLRGTALVPSPVRTYDEHMVVERKDESLWMLLRTKYGIGESFSTDRGKTWTVTTPSAIAHTASRFFIRRLASGNLLLVKHGPMKERTGRSHLMAFISKDDGKTWAGGLLLDERSGISYPDGQQAADGTIYMTYDFNRSRDRAIFVATFTEADALAGQAVSDKVRLRMLVSSPGVWVEPPTAAYKPEALMLRDNKDGVAIFTSSVAVLRPVSTNDVVDTLRVGALLWHDRNYVVSVLPKELAGLQFFRTNIRQLDIRGVVAQEGVLYIMAHRDADTSQLTKRGFKKTNVAEFVPYAVKGEFKTNDGFSVYQKQVKKGDLVEVGQWGIPVFAAK